MTLTRDGSLVSASSTEGAAHPLHGALDGRGFSGSIYDSDLIWLDGECFDFGKARGRARGPADAREQEYEGSFELVMD